MKQFDCKQNKVLFSIFSLITLLIVFAVVQSDVGQVRGNVHITESFDIFQLIAIELNRNHLDSGSVWHQSEVTHYFVVRTIRSESD
jgi:hypothetical protein